MKHVYATETGCGLIVESNDGEAWSNQVNGVSCQHPVAKGYFIPFEEPSRLQEGTCCVTFDDKVCDMVDAIFKRAGLPFSVDRSRMEEAVEAWIPVIIKESGAKGIFAYSNCD